ncbi:uncharacterized protein LOC128214673 [Mya arenaria]|uniref:uncharacterized protein LOC128214673 n=1 Tax=Mya arenaria TaxID=6604 RepID=UPI0022E4A503|nr:uncharacterized protein LOC128214673 [Mya arenaria]XP_052777228.1 uncharacterized protein LOC128214673 [Mya arenaria]
MPVYVTRAHVTIGDANKKRSAKRGPIVPKHVFQVSDIRKTPYCARTFFVTFVGMLVVAGGIIMTIIGYKPGILLPWYRSANQTNINVTNVTEPSAVPSVLGEPGPLRVLVYIGPILMGLGVFSMMVSIVLFCEIKDRYFNNIIPKTMPEQRKKEIIYDRIIEEFRKNYFRGIEVPLRPPTRRKSKGRFSFSLSPTGSIMSFGRRLSHEFQKRKRKQSKESQTEKPPSTKTRRSIRKLVESDTWMKTSSLPNIRHKDSFHNLHDMECQCTCAEPVGRESRQCSRPPDHIQIVDESGLDNPAYNDSPPDKRFRPPLTKHASLDTPGRNTYVTTVVVHRELASRMESEGDRRGSSVLPELRCSKYDPELKSNDSGDQNDSVIDIDKDIDVQFTNVPDLNNEQLCRPVFTRTNTNETDSEILPGVTDNNIMHKMEDVCTCGSPGFCQQHTLGMDSGDSSLSLSWDNIPSSWNDTRRNTEPIVVYKRSFNNVSGSASQLGSLPQNISEDSDEGVQKPAYSWSSPTSVTGETANHSRLPRTNVHRKIIGPFKTKVSVFKSDSNLLRVGMYSLLRRKQGDDISLESLNLTDDMLKNFEMAETGYI